MRHHPQLREKTLKEIERILSEKNLQKFKSCDLLLLSAEELSRPVQLMPENVTVFSPCESSTEAQIIEEFAKFMEGFCQTSSTTKDLIDRNIFPLFLKFLYQLPYDFTTSHRSYAVSHLGRILVDANPTKVILCILNEFDQIYPQISLFINSDSNDSFFRACVEATSLNRSCQNIFHSLIAIQSLLGLLCEVISSLLYSSSNNSALNVGELFNMDLVEKIFSVSRACIWEFGAYKNSLPLDWLVSKKPPNLDESKEKSEKTENLLPDPTDKRIFNCRALKYLLMQVPKTIVPLILCKNIFLLIFFSDS